jgi:hypothetical protein
MHSGRDMAQSNRARAAIAAGALAVLLTGAWAFLRDEPSEDAGSLPASSLEVREALWAELQPIALENCEMERFGEPHDGGYLMCGNLLGAIAAGYSYGISGYDGWGCDISTRFDVPVQQYDCFDLTQPACPAGRTTFHPECIAPRTFADEAGRPFDTMQNQFARNGDGDRRIVMKIDVEGAEWDSFFHAPERVLERIDQLAVEFHGTDRRRYLETVRRLKQHFYVAHLHFNNYSCREDLAPFPAEAYEVLFVSKRLGVVAPARAVERPHRLDTPNNPGLPDCQGPAARS